MRLFRSTKPAEYTASFLFCQAFFFGISEKVSARHEAVPFRKPAEYTASFLFCQAFFFSEFPKKFPPDMRLFRSAKTRFLPRLFDFVKHFFQVLIFIL
jgi:hypothetical protein